MPPSASQSNVPTLATPASVSATLRIVAFIPSHAPHRGPALRFTTQISSDPITVSSKFAVVNFSTEAAGWDCLTIQAWSASAEIVSSLDQRTSVFSAARKRLIVG